MQINRLFLSPLPAKINSNKPPWFPWVQSYILWILIYLQTVVLLQVMYLLSVCTYVACIVQYAVHQCVPYLLWQWLDFLRLFILYQTSSRNYFKISRVPYLKEPNFSVLLVLKKRQEKCVFVNSYLLTNKRNKRTLCGEPDIQNHIIFNKRMCGPDSQLYLVSLGMNGSVIVRPP